MMNKLDSLPSLETNRSTPTDAERREPLEEKVQRILQELRLDPDHQERILKDKMFFVLQARRNFAHVEDVTDVALRTYLLTEATMYAVHYTFDEDDDD